MRTLARPSASRSLAAVLALAAAAAAASAVGAAEKNYRLKDTDLKARVLWGAECDGPDGGGLAFGGEDQQADDGRPHTRVRDGGQWRAIHEALRAANPLQPLHDRVWAIRSRVKDAAAAARSVYFRGLPAPEERKAVEADLLGRVEKVRADLEAEARACESPPGRPGAYAQGQAKAAAARLRDALARIGALALADGVTDDAVRAMAAAQVELEQAAEALDAEPPPRALSPLVYEPRTGLYLLFGGDHLDYLTNDTWAFDPKARRWTNRRPPTAPSPRARHTLEAAGDGKVVLKGGYTYASNTDYCGGQYRDVADGEWVFDAIAGTWTGSGTAAPPDSRVYRTGPFHPDFYLAGPRPDAAAGEAHLADLPVNRWVDLAPPHRPRQNRDWGTVTLDPDRDQILVWSGGHSAHGGSDVLHYHLATNRWELPYPVEFPLGQLYSNTSYPDGFNFNRRPWVTGHTYQNYAYDPVSRRLVFTGHPGHFYVYDPDVADWVGRGPKPKGMIYSGCFYDLTVCPTPWGLVCWAPEGRLYRYDPAAGAWKDLAVEGKLPGPAVDYSAIAYDARRDRLLLIRSDYGKPFDGQVWAVDLKGLTAAALEPANRAAAASVTFTIDRACYEPEGDLMLLCALLPPEEDGSRRTPAYDCAGNRWVSLRIGYETADEGRRPRVPGARGRSCGLVYDARRKLVWGVDTNRVDVYALRLDAKAASPKALD